MKVDVVAEDPTEQGARKLLNLGHTFGHGVEAAGRFSHYTHGEAVGLGLAFAFRLARRMGRVGDGVVETVEGALRRAGLPVQLPPAAARAAARLMAFDKKRTAAGLRWVLPSAHGDSWIVEWDVEARGRGPEVAGSGQRRSRHRSGEGLRRGARGRAEEAHDPARERPQPEPARRARAGDVRAHHAARDREDGARRVRRMERGGEGVPVESRGALIDFLQEHRGRARGIVINAGRATPTRATRSTTA